MSDLNRLYREDVFNKTLNSTFSLPLCEQCSVLVQCSPRKSTHSHSPSFYMSNVRTQGGAQSSSWCLPFTILRTLSRRQSCGVKHETVHGKAFNTAQRWGESRTPFGIQSTGYDLNTRYSGCQLKTLLTWPPVLTSVTAPIQLPRWGILELFETHSALYAIHLIMSYRQIMSHRQ